MKSKASFPWSSTKHESTSIRQIPRNRTVDFTWKTGFEEDECCLIERKDNVYRFLGFTRSDLHRLPRERKIVLKTVLKKYSSTMRTHRLTLSSSTMNKLVEWSHKLLSYSTYYTDSICDFYCFKTWKNHSSISYLSRIRMLLPSRSPI